MKKILFLAALCVAIGSMAETAFLYNADSHELTQKKDGITVTIGQGSGSNAPRFSNEYYLEQYHPEMRLYVGNTITLTSTSALKDIKMVFAMAGSKKEYTKLEANNGTLISGGTSTDITDWKVDRWTGNETSIVFTLKDGKQRQIYSLVVDGEALIPATPEEKPLPTEADLVSNYDYPEPTVVGVPDTTILKKEYAFIENNILVHCDQGSIIKATDTTFAYFNCNQDNTITFTASQNIKGIAISGYVRKAFNATCDHGTITFLTNPDYEMEGWPALVITDVNNKSVTLSCPKQFRCYELNVYFKENPAPIPMATILPQQDEKSRQTIKILRNGQFLILHHGQLFNAVGQQVE